MNPNLDSLLKGSKNNDIWLAISENRIVDALQSISRGPTGKERGFLGIFRKKAMVPDLDPARRVAWELLSGKPDPLLVRPASRLKEAGDHFPEWIRFCCAGSF